MRKTIVIPVAKSPHSKGRIGPEKWQDWFQGVKRAVSIAKRLGTGTEVLILSNAQYSGQQHEVDLYYEAFVGLGGRTGINIRVLREGYETIEQINRSFELAVTERKELVFISTFFHYLRVQWLIWRCKTAKVKVKHYVVLFGIPRPREILTDIALTILFPLIDIFGGRRFFLKAVNRRRIKGKL